MEGMSVIASDEATSDELNIIVDIFNGMGQTVVVDEKYMDAVTALSGSGPAYFFYFAEAMEKFAVDAGIEKEIARKLAAQTILGAGRLMNEDENTDFAQLRKNVTSPGGTTQAAIEYLESQSCGKIFYEALNKAKNRSKELSKND
jgi:pyrroline-5-carboxylate reductase